MCFSLRSGIVANVWQMCQNSSCIFALAGMQRQEACIQQGHYEALIGASQWLASCPRLTTSTCNGRQAATA